MRLSGRRDGTRLVRGMDTAVSTRIIVGADRPGRYLLLVDGRAVYRSSYRADLQFSGRSFDSSAVEEEAVDDAAWLAALGDGSGVRWIG